MLQRLFSFQGRMGRLEFLGWFLILIVTTLVNLVISAVLVVRLLSTSSTDSWLVLLGDLLLFLLCFWSSLAIQSKRIRDIGWLPVLVIPALFAFGILDAMVLTRLMPGLALPRLAHQSVLGVLVSVAYLGALLLWPGRSEGGVPREETDAAPRAPVADPRVSQVRISPSMHQASAPRTDRATGLRRQEFGLRGR